MLPVPFNPAQHSSSLAAVYHLLSDGDWHSQAEIRAIAPSADSRVRDLRKPEFGGHTIERAHERALKRGDSTRLYYFRLVK